MTPKQVKHMVDRFLGWRLPENFQPDAGISFKPGYSPTGTNLLNSLQAEEMVRHMIDGMPEELE
jgi:hypothetical protein